MQRPPFDGLIDFSGGYFAKFSIPEKDEAAQGKTGPLEPRPWDLFLARVEGPPKLKGWSLGVWAKQGSTKLDKVKQMPR